MHRRQGIWGLLTGKAGIGHVIGHVTFQKGGGRVKRIIGI